MNIPTLPAPSDRQQALMEVNDVIDDMLRERIPEEDAISFLDELAGDISDKIAILKKGMKFQ